MKKSKLFIKVLSYGLTVLIALSMTACGGSSGGNITVSFMYGGDVAIVELYNSLIEEFNKTEGKKEKIKIKGIPKTSSIDSVLSQQLPGNNGPDVVSISDKEFKKFSSYFDDMTGKIDQKTLDDFYSNTISRYHYNTSTTTSNSDDPLYGVPGYNDTTVLYYNKTALEKAGVICISVEQKDLDAFNKGSFKDANGKSKSDYGITVNVPAKGFYRSMTPFVSKPDETNGSSWQLPADDEILIFNDKIALNWDEIEDIGLICTQDRNPDSATKYGYYTEWWFNYGWSVGGDCLEDMSGKGDWTYSLASDLPNYIVADGKTYTGIYSGTNYKSGETLSMIDVVDAKVGDTISYETDNSTYFYYTINGSKAEHRNFDAEISNGTLVELPSIKEAFSRFCYLAGNGGINVCPYPDAFTGSNSVYYFTSGSLAFLTEKISCASSIKKMMKDDWGVALLPIYKTYTEPTNPNCDTIAKQGKVAAHSLGYSVCVNSKTKVKDAAYKFINWIATEGQKFMAKSGEISSRKSDRDLFLENCKYDNAAIILDSAENAKAGDWWYMPDTNWITVWANTLNGKVRYGKMDFETFLYSCIAETNKRLQEYKK